MTEIRNAVEDESRLQMFDLREALERLWVAFYGAAAQSKDKSGKWTNLAERLWFPAAAGVLGALPSTVIAATQLTQGAN